MRNKTRFDASFDTFSERSWNREKSNGDDYDSTGRTAWDLNSIST